MSHWTYELLFSGGISSANVIDKRYPQVSITTNLQDAHIYIFKRWVIDFITRNQKLSSLRSDLLPVLAKMQWQSILRKREGVDERKSLIYKGETSADKK
jgi:hypothetical protein